MRRVRTAPRLEPRAQIGIVGIVIERNQPAGGFRS